MYNTDDLLKKHAGQYHVEPSPASFEKMMAKRSAQRRKRLLLICAPLTVLFALGAYFMFSLPDHKQLAATPAGIENTTAAAHEPAPMGTITNPAKNIIAHKQAALKIKTIAAPNVKADQTNPVQAYAQAYDKAAGQAAIRASSVPVATMAVGSTLNKQHAKPVSIAPVAVADHAHVAKSNDQQAAINNQAEPTLSGDTIQVSTGPKPDLLTATMPHVTAVKPLTDTAQNTTMAAGAMPKLTARIPRWAFSMFYTALPVNNAMSANTASELIPNPGDNSDKALYAWNAGLRLERKTGRFLGLATGIILSHIKFDAFTGNVKSGPVYNKLNVQSLASTDIKGIENRYYDLDFTRIEIPLLLTASVQHKQLNVKMLAGVSYSYLIKTATLVNGSDSNSVKRINDNKNTRLQQQQWMLNAGLHVEYLVIKNISVYAGPTLRYCLSPAFNKNYVVRPRPYFAGLEAGVTFSF